MKLICRQKMDAKKWCKLHYGAYAETHEDQEITNTLKSRTRPAIHLGPIKNLNGSTRLRCLQTGAKIVWHNFTPSPLPDLVIKQVEEMGKKDKTNSELTFLDREKNQFDCGEGEDSTDEGNSMKDLETVPYPDIQAEML